MENDQIKKEVRQHYAAIAKSGGSCCAPSSSCCGGSSNIPISVTMNEEYTQAPTEIVANADLGLGCGTPVEYADLKPGMTVLDLGSGAGIDVFLSAKNVGPSGKVIGLDMTQEMIDRAEANRQKLGFTNVEFHLGEIENMPVDSESVDRVISNCVINLLPDKKKGFSEIYRVLRKGGKVVISDIVTRGTIPDDIRKDAELWASCVSGAMDIKEYLRLMSEVGLKHLLILSERTYPMPEGSTFEIFSVTVRGTR